MPETKETDIFNLADGGAPGAEKKLAIFIENTASGEPACIVGTTHNRKLLQQVVGEFVVNEIDNHATGGEEIEILVRCFWMTPEEIANLPEI